MRRRPPRSTRTDTLFPYTTLFRSGAARHQDVAAISDALTQHRRLQARHDSGFGIIVEREDRDGGLADRKGGCGDDRRDHPVEVVGEHEQGQRSEEHTSELQSLMRISYAVFCLKKTKQTPRNM